LKLTQFIFVSHRDWWIAWDGVRGLARQLETVVTLELAIEWEWKLGIPTSRIGCFRIFSILLPAGYGILLVEVFSRTCRCVKNNPAFQFQYRGHHEGKGYKCGGSFLLFPYYSPMATRRGSTFGLPGSSQPTGILSPNWMFYFSPISQAPMEIRMLASVLWTLFRLAAETPHAVRV
jgi:hypothetical protein